MIVHAEVAQELQLRRLRNLHTPFDAPLRYMYSPNSHSRLGAYSMKSLSKLPSLSRILRLEIEHGRGRTCSFHTSSGAPVPCTARAGSSRRHRRWRPNPARSRSGVPGAGRRTPPWGRPGRCRRSRGGASGRSSREGDRDPRMPVVEVEVEGELLDAAARELLEPAAAG
jgi:hypothetical protein